MLPKNASHIRQHGHHQTTSWDHRQGRSLGELISKVDFDEKTQSAAAGQDAERDVASRLICAVVPRPGLEDLYKRAGVTRRDKSLEAASDAILAQPMKAGR